MSATGQTRGFAGRLSKGAGTHLASWLQEVDTPSLTMQEAQALLDADASGAAPTANSGPRGERALKGLLEKHSGGKLGVDGQGVTRANREKASKCLGHAKLITHIAYSGDMIVSKDTGSMRLWRAGGDFCLLRVVSCPGPHVAFHHTGQFIVTGARTATAAAVTETPIENMQEDEDAATASAEPKVSSVLKIWGPAGGSAVGAGKTEITMNKNS